jgi:addiction module HigA family antidote
MPMKNPPHPGRSIRNACLEPLGLSVTAGAKVLGVTRQTLNNVINGKSGISPEIRQHAGNVVANAGCLRPRRRPEG